MRVPTRSERLHGASEWGKKVMNEWKTLVDEADRLLTEKHKVDEAQRAFTRVQLRKIEKQLLADGECAVREVKTTLARIAERLGDLDRASDRWQRIVTDDGVPTEDAAAGVIRSLLGAGRYADAEEKLHELNESNVRVPNLKALTKEVGSSARVQSANEHWKHAKEFLREGRRESFRDSATKATEARGFVGGKREGFLRFIDAIIELWETCSDTSLWNEVSAVTTRARRAQKVGSEFPGIVLCAGLGHSGSGAVFDYLRASQDVGVIATREINLLDKAVQTLLREPRLRELGVRGVQQAVLDYIGAAIFGFGDPAAAIEKQNRSLRKSVAAVLARDDMNFAALVDDCIILIRSMSKPPNDPGERVVHWQQSFQRFAKATIMRYSKGKPVVAFSNLVKAHNIRSVPDVLGGSAVSIVVTRDPRDQYADRMMALGGRVETVEEFVSTYTTRMKSVSRYIAKRKRSAYVHRVQFEDFVMDRRMRRKMLDALPFEVSDRDCESGFVFCPEQSKNNVGIHRSVLDEATRLRIEQDLSAYCLDIVGSW